MRLCVYRLIIQYSKQFSSVQSSDFMSACVFSGVIFSISIPFNPSLVYYLIS